MPPVPVKLLPIAQEDVSQALAVIAVEDPAAAEKLRQGFLKALEQVSMYPYSGAEIMVGGRNRRVYHRLYVAPYVMYYRVIQDTVVVMRVLHERMDRRKHLP